jgi:hypothetical protein
MDKKILNPKIIFSEWTEKELLHRKTCYCDCHSHPGTYPTDEEHPCHVCGHVNMWGYFPYPQNTGWVEYWRSDKVGEYVTSD